MQVVAKVVGEVGVYGGDLVQGVADAGADGFAGTFGGISESTCASAESGGDGQFMNERRTFGAKLLDVGGAAMVLGVVDLGVEGAEASPVLRFRCVVEDRVGASARRLHAEKGEDVDVAALGADEQGEIPQAFGVGQQGVMPVEAEMPQPVVKAELVGRPGPGSSGRVRASSESRAQPGGAESFVQPDRGAEVLLGCRGVSQGGGQGAEVVVDGGVVGGAAGDDHVGAGQRA